MEETIRVITVQLEASKAQKAQNKRNKQQSCTMQSGGRRSYQNVGRYEPLLLLVIVIVVLVPVQCFTYNNAHRCLTKGIRTSLIMRGFPTWFPEINPNRPNSIWFSTNRPKDIYSNEKKDLLRAIAATRSRKTSSSGEGSMTDRQTILSCVSILETMYANRRQSLSLTTPTTTRRAGVEDVSISLNQCADGAWSLIYSTKQQPPKKSPSLFPSSTTSILSTWVDKISGELYKVFFRFAPLLAGGQDESTNRGLTARTVTTKPPTSPSSVNNKQLIDLVNRKVVNVVTFENALLTKLFGARQTASDEDIGSSISGIDSSRASAKTEIRVLQPPLSLLRPITIP